MFVYFVYRRVYCGERYSFPLGLISSCAVCVFSLVAVFVVSWSFLLEFYWRCSTGFLTVVCQCSTGRSVCSSEREATRGPCLPRRQPRHSVARRRTHPGAVIAGTLTSRNQDCRVASVWLCGLSALSLLVSVLLYLCLWCNGIISVSTWLWYVIYLSEKRELEWVVVAIDLRDIADFLRDYPWFCYYCSAVYIALYVCYTILNKLAPSYSRL